MPSDAQNQSRTVLGADCHIAGDLTIDNDATLLGQFEGELRVTRSIEVGESARVRGTVVAGTVLMAGEVEAVIVAEHAVHLLPGCRVKGRIFAPQLQVEEGAIFDGDLCVSPTAMESAEAFMNGRKQPASAPRASMRESGGDEGGVRTMPSAVATLLERRRQQQQQQEAAGDAQAA
ncbi:bactofilin family protein [Mucisphaera sp.]|uniref:bactofilin family protein n=1 Tax=Mucisphaera sp. TaxID=2913024 RepID=UPI003D123DAD